MKKVFNNNAWIIIGLIALVLLLGTSDFIASAIDPCKNEEPTSLQGYQTSISSLGGTMGIDGVFTVNVNNQLKSYNKYKAESPLGVFHVIPLEPHGMTCSAFLSQAHTSPVGRAGLPQADCLTGWAVVNGVCIFNECFRAASGINVYDTKEDCMLIEGITNAEYVLIQQRQVLKTEAGYLWCSYNQNFALLTEQTQTIINYYDEYATCERTRQQLIKDSNTCHEANGEWINGACYCGVNKMREGQTCNIDDVGEPDPSQPIQLEPGIEEPTTNLITSRLTTTNTTIIVALVLLLLVALYWKFEKGPRKGLIQKNRFRRKRK